VQGGDVDAGIVDLDLRVLRHLARGDRPRALDVDRQDLALFRVQMDGHLLQVEDDVGDVLDHPGDGRELVEHALDVDRRHRRPLDRGEQAAAEGIADRRGEAPLERLGHELAIGLSKRIALYLDALGALKTFPKHRNSFVSWPLDELAAVELDDQLLLDRELDVLTHGQPDYLAADVLRVQLQPLGDAAPARCLDARADKGVLAAGLLDADRLAGLHLIGGDGGLPAVHLHVPVAHKLARLRPRGGEPEAIDDVVQPLLEHHQEVLAGDPLLPVRLLEIGAELGLEHPVDALDLLLLAQLQAVAQGAASAPRAVLARREVAALDGTLLLEAAVALQKQLHPLAAAEPANGSRVSRHWFSPRSSSPRGYGDSCSGRRPAGIPERPGSSGTRRLLGLE